MSEHRPMDGDRKTDRDPVGSDPVGSDPVGRDPVARLVTLAGPRAALGAERTARLQEAVRPHWRRAVERHGSRRFRRLWTLPGVWLPAVAAAAAVALLATFGLARLDLGGDRGRAEPVATLAHGAIQAGNSLLASGGTIFAGQTISSGEAARGAVRLRSGVDVRLDYGTRLRLRSGDRLQLLAGAVYVDTEDATGGSIRIETGVALVEDIGTQFEVRLLATGVRVRVRDGRVVLHHERGPVEGGRGEELMLLPDGTASRSALATWGEAWNWTLELVEARSFDGESLESFLAWVHRETGREIRFADPEREAVVLSQRLLGDLSGLSVDDALATALPTYGIEYAVENGVFVLY